MATILVVDDDFTNRQVLSTILGYRAHKIVEAADGREGLEKTQSERPDLAIVDIVMPTMDGSSLCANSGPIPPSPTRP
jgi:two-component system response regulator MprA